MKVAYSSTKTMQQVIAHHLRQPLLRGFDQDGGERWQAIVDKLAQLIEPVAAEVEAIFTDPKLTDEGKQEKALTIGPRVVQNFQNLGTVLTEADRAKARLEAVLFSPLVEPPKGHEVVHEIRAAEIRRAIGKKDAAVNYLRAIDRDDLETVKALTTPPGPAWLTAEVQRRGREAYAQRTNPAGWEQLRYVEFLRDNLSALAEQVAQWLVTLGASPEAIQKATKAKG